MPSTETTRREYERCGWRYASDMTDDEWALIVPFMPARKRTGRPCTTALRDVVDAILYMAATDCRSAMNPKDFPPPSRVQRYWPAPRCEQLLAVYKLDLCIRKTRDGEDTGAVPVQFP
jgi:transposase